MRTHHTGTHHTDPGAKIAPGERVSTQTHPLHRRRPLRGVRGLGVLGCGALLLTTLVGTAQPSAAHPATTTATPAVADTALTRGPVVLDDTALSYAAQQKGWQARAGAPGTTAAGPGLAPVAGPTGSVPGAPGALVTPGALLELPSGPLGIPGAALVAYRTAADEVAASTPGCHLSWSLLAGIGRIESGHASGGRVDAAGTTLGPILGPVLDGANPGDGVVRDTDGGRYDGNTTFDRAVGPMQFIPGTWAAWGADGNHDGVKDPSNVYDAALAAGDYLCSGGLDTADPAQARTAVFRYNNSDAYVTNVLAWAAGYARGVQPTDSELGPVPAPVDPVPAPAPADPTTPAPAATTAPAPTTSTAPAPAPTSTGPATAPTTPPATTTTTAPAPAASARWFVPAGAWPVCGAETVTPVDPAAPDSATRVLDPSPLCVPEPLAPVTPGFQLLPPA